MEHLFEILDRIQLNHSSQYGGESIFIETMRMLAFHNGLISEDEIEDFEHCCRARYRHQNYSFHTSEDGYIFVGQYIS